MGTCISKCNPKKKTSTKNHKNEPQKPKECKCQNIEQNNTNLVQDKIVISQVPISSLKSPLSPSKSSSLCTNSNYPTTSSSSSSCSLVSSASSLTSYSSSSIVSSKFEPCEKENPKIIRPDYIPIKVINSKRSSLPTKCHISGKNLNGPKQLLPPPSSPQRVSRPLAQKRPRCSSPSNLTRQKSFRRESEPETESSNKPISISGRYSRPISPSPSKRITRETSINQSRSFTNSMRRENCYVRPPSPRRINGSSRRYGRSNNLLIKNEDGIKMVNSKIQELAIGGLSTQDIDMMPVEDAENPHIALDCFIFL